MIYIIERHQVTTKTKLNKKKIKSYFKFFYILKALCAFMNPSSCYNAHYVCRFTAVASGQSVPMRLRVH